MEGFTYDHHPSLLDSGYRVHDQQVEEFITTNLSSCFPDYYKSAHDAISYDRSNSINSGSSTAPASAATGPADHQSMEKEREDLNGTSKESKDSRRRQRKSSSTGGLKEAAGEIKGIEEPPSSYILVRARRGQATDSHSLAERVRRGRISERMKMLQSLVPGCEKIIGKAHVLDEIIKYVQSLQNQVEFLSMTLASLNPIVYDLCEGFDDCMNQQERMVEGMITYGFQTNHILPTPFGNATNSYYPVMDSTSNLLLQGQWPTTFSEDNDSFLVGDDSRQQSFLEFNNV